ncbi:MAG TPA: hypothetical protein VF789_22315 [Thermoanaerobaculia bacterium]
MLSRDPPMGMASGIFQPSPEYAELQPIYRAHFEMNADIPDWVWNALDELQLRAVAEDGETISDHVHIFDATGELPDEPMMVDVRCPTAEVYETYFPEHSRNYDSAFEKEDAV